MRLYTTFWTWTRIWFWGNKSVFLLRKTFGNVALQLNLSRNIRFQTRINRDSSSNSKQGSEKKKEMVLLFTICLFTTSLVTAAAFPESQHPKCLFEISYPKNDDFLLVCFCSKMFQNFTKSLFSGVENRLFCGFSCWYSVLLLESQRPGWKLHFASSSSTSRSLRFEIFGIWMEDAVPTALRH